MQRLGLWPRFDRGDLFGEKYVKVNQVLRQMHDALETDFWTLDAIWWFLDESELKQLRLQKTHRQRARTAIQAANASRRKCPYESISDAALNEIRAAVLEIKGKLSMMRASNTVTMEISIDIRQIEEEVQRPAPSRLLLKSFLEKLKDRLMDHVTKVVHSGVTAALGILGGILAKYFGI